MLDEGGAVRFPEYDAWHHMRLVDALVRDFPHRIHYDAYGYFGGQPVRSGPLLDLVVAGAALAAGRGAPSAELVDLVGAWVPAILGALAVLPIYGLGRLLFGPGAALAAAALFAVLPNGLLRRTSFGFTDHHVLEVLLGALTLYALARALRAAPAFDSTRHDRCPHPGARRRPLAAAIAAAIALGAYLLSWTSGVFLVAILLLWQGIELCLRAARGAPLAPIAAIGAVVFAAALPPVLLFAGDVVGMDLAAYALAVGTGLSLLVAALARPLSRVAGRWRVPSLLATLLVPVVVVAIVRPDALGAAAGAALRLVPRGEVAHTVFEMQPLLADPAAAWLTYVTAWPFALVGLVLAAARWRRTRESELLLVLVFAAASLAATLVQMRFSIYLAIPIALCGGLAVDRGLSRTAARRPLQAALLALLFVPTGAEAVRTARLLNPMPSWWIDAMRWLRESTPEPFADPAAYYARLPRPPVGQPFAYPETAYSVLSWWDYGYLIERVGRRIPVTNPTQHNAAAAAAFLLASDPIDAGRRLERLAARYVVVDGTMAFHGAKLAAITWIAGRAPIELVESCKLRQPDGAFTDQLVFYPAYYQSMAARLWVFGAEAYEPHYSTFVLAAEEHISPEGVPHCEIASMRLFPTHAEALEALAATPGARIAGVSPAASPVPLERLEAFRLVYDSARVAIVPGTATTVPMLRIFEHAGGG